MPCATQFAWILSTSSTQTVIHTPRSPVWDAPPSPVDALLPLPRPPWAPRQRKISHSPEPTEPNVGGEPQSHFLIQPSLPNQAKLSSMFDTFRIGVIAFAYMGAASKATWTGSNPRARFIVYKAEPPTRTRSYQCRPEDFASRPGQERQR